MKKLFLLFLIVFLVSGQAYALTIELDVVNDLNVPVISPYATVVIDELSPNIFDFTVDANDLLNVGGLTNFGIQTFGFNSNVTLQESYFTLPANWSVDFSRPNSLSMFGLYYTQTDADRGNVRQDPLEFTITIPGDPTNPDIMETDFYVNNLDGYAFAVHIADIGPYDNNVKSAWFSAGGGGGGTGDPVPEPGTLVLLGCGLLGLAGVARKKRSQ